MISLLLGLLVSVPKKACGESGKEWWGKRSDQELNLR